MSDSTPIVFFDLETGGLENHHPDIQLAAVAVANGAELGVFEEKIVFDESKATQEALSINSYDREIWEQEAMPESIAVRSFAEWLAPYRTIPMISKNGKSYKLARLAGHNVARFDAPRLIRMFQRYSQFLAADAFRPLDTVQLALWHFLGESKQPKSYKLGDLCTHLAINTEGAHDALTDVRMTIALARKIIGDNG